MKFDANMLKMLLRQLTTETQILLLMQIQPPDQENNKGAASEAFLTILAEDFQNTQNLMSFVAKAQIAIEQDPGTDASARISKNTQFVLNMWKEQNNAR